jgi:putative membrane protein
MLKEGINGFCMALADSVPGVSGGTVAFIMGFYDQFIGSIHNLAFGKMKEKKSSLRYLAKLGIGWAAGMLLAVLALSALFESQIYIVSSLFIGFIAGAIPLIIREERDSFREVGKGIGFCLLGILLVVGITWLNGQTGGSTMDLGQFSIGLGIRLFFIGMIAISAMFLPGISGSTLLLIFGAYIPVISAVRSVMSFDFSVLPSLLFFGCGVLAGAVTVVKAIKVCLERFRPQTVYMILGMMIGSFYAIIQGPTTLEIPKAAMNFGNFQIIPCLVGVALVAGMQMIKERSEENVNCNDTGL